MSILSNLFSAILSFSQSPPYEVGIKWNHSRSNYIEDLPHFAFDVAACWKCMFHGVVVWRRNVCDNETFPRFQSLVLVFHIVSTGRQKIVRTFQYLYSIFFYSRGHKVGSFSVEVGFMQPVFHLGSCGLVFQTDPTTTPMG